MASEQLEQEIKFEAGAGVAVPSLDGVAGPGGRVEVATVRLASVYFDTEAHDLLRRGITLRCRTGDTDNGWQLKVPTGDARTEIRLDPTSNQTTVPKELATLVSGVRRGKALRHIVTIRTDRTVKRVTNSDGDLLVEVADDRVDAVAPGPQSVTLTDWREIEAELGPAGTPDTLPTVRDLLIGAGATISASPNKVAAALGVGAGAGGSTDGVTKKSTAGEVIRAYLTEQDDALIAGDLTLRRGLGGIHPTRVATRRLRSTLRVFGDYFDSDRAAAFDGELRWYAALLGEVRDREVQRERFATAIAELPADQVLGPVAATIEEVLLSEQVQHQKALEKAMTGRRYLALIREAGEWATSPPSIDQAGRKANALRRQVDKSAKKVAKHLSAGLSSGDDEELHKARKAGKRARYAAELAAPVLGKKSKAGVDAYKDLQDILGDHQDGVVAAELIRRIAAGTASRPNENGFTYGLLYAGELRKSEASKESAGSWKAPSL